MDYLNFFNKIISKVLPVYVKINEEDKVLILLSLLSQSYDHIATIILYGKKTLILEKVMLTLLSNEIRKRPNQEEQTGLGFVITGRKERSRLIKGISLLSQRRSLEE